MNQCMGMADGARLHVDTQAVVVVGKDEAYMVLPLVETRQQAHAWSSTASRFMLHDVY